MTCDKWFQDTTEKLLYEVDFSDFLGSAAIASATWVVPSELTESDSGTDGNIVFNYIENSTGVIGNEIEVNVTITTDETVARKKTKSFKIELKGDCD